MIPVSELISLRGRRALVTGAASGIGEAIARRLAEAGAALLRIDVQEEALHRLADRLRAAGGEAYPFRLDLGDEEAARAFWKSLPEKPSRRSGPGHPGEQRRDLSLSRFLGG
ncbi:MAG: SDR family NAD(P)-dependent oxidoreductase [Thermoflexus sp.]|nr:SDR family NAD(P)-dependent oxidoreductase [Thermoflexus sp.]